MIKQNTIIAYFNADNNLDGFALKDIYEIEKGMKINFSNNFSNNNVLVYLDRANGTSPSYGIILEIGYDKNPNFIDSKVVKILGERDSSSRTSLGEVLNFSFKNYPAENYGLIAWSHGTGWLPKGVITVGSRMYKGGQQIFIKTFGVDYFSTYSKMSIQDFFFCYF